MTCLVCVNEQKGGGGERKTATSGPCCLGHTLGNGGSHYYSPPSAERPRQEAQQHARTRRAAQARCLLKAHALSRPSISKPASVHRPSDARRRVAGAEDEAGTRVHAPYTPSACPLHAAAVRTYIARGRSSLRARPRFERLAVGVTCVLCVISKKESGVSEKPRLPGPLVLATPSATEVDITIRPQPPKGQGKNPSNTRARSAPRKLDVIEGARPFSPVLQSATQPPSAGRRAWRAQRARRGRVCAHHTRRRHARYTPRQYVHISRGGGPV